MWACVCVHVVCVWGRRNTYQGSSKIFWLTSCGSLLGKISFLLVTGQDFFFKRLIAHVSQTQPHNHIYNHRLVQNLIKRRVRLKKNFPSEHPSQPCSWRTLADHTQTLYRSVVKYLYLYGQYIFTSRSDPSNVIARTVLVATRRSNADRLTDRAVTCLDNVKAVDILFARMCMLKFDINCHDTVHLATSVVAMTKEVGLYRFSFFYPSQNRKSFHV